MKLTETKDGVIFDIYVKPHSSKFEVRVEGEEIVVLSSEEPEKGKVNKEIIKEFTKMFHKPAEIVSGATSRQKRLFIACVGKAEAENILNSR